MGKKMPEKGTSRIREILSPVKKPAMPSFRYTFLTASVSPEYSWKPRTSRRVFITIIGFDRQDWKPRAQAEAQKLTAWSDMAFVL